MNRSRDRSLGEGVYYKKIAYAGLVRRLIVIVIDSILLIGFGILLWLLLLFFAWDADTGDFTWNPSVLFWVAWLATVWVYLAVLKPSKWRTVGYRLTGLKIVTIRGQRPSLFRMTFRMLLWMFGPFNLLLDLMWLGADSEQQSLRDCYAGTYVVRLDAEPIGHAPVHLAYYTAFCFTLVYPHVVRPKPASDAA